MGDPGIGAGHKSPCPIGQGKGSPRPAQSGEEGGEELGAEFLLHPQAEELVNTAPLTGVPRHVPVRLVTVDRGGALVEVTEHIGCESANPQVLQVSGTCQPHVSTRFRVELPPFPIQVLKRTASTSFVPTISLQNQVGAS